MPIINDPPVSVRFIEYQGKKYLRLEDVADFIRTLSDGEETDVRNRINAAADRLLQTRARP